MTLQEIDALEHLTEMKCSSSPRLLAEMQMEQDETMWIPGGYVDCILMERLPGRAPLDFWSWPREKRDELRRAFLESMSYVAVSSAGFEND